MPTQCDVTNASLEDCANVGELSWMESPVEVVAGSKITRNGAEHVVLRCEHQGLRSESQPWSLALVKLD